MHATKEAKYDGIFHIHALASVCKMRVRSIYPKAALNIHELYDRLCLPRNEEAGKIISRDLNNNASSLFKPKKYLVILLI